MSIDEKAFEDALMMMANSLPLVGAVEEAWVRFMSQGKIGLRQLFENYEAAKVKNGDAPTSNAGVGTATVAADAYGDDAFRHSHFNGQPDEFTSLGVLADIRRKTGVGDKPMLSELADMLASLIQNGQIAIETNKLLAARLSEREAVDDKLHELILRLARACDCATIVSCGAEDDKMQMLRLVDQVSENIFRHTQIKGFVEIWLAKEFPDRYQLEQMPVNEKEQPRRGRDD